MPESALLIEYFACVGCWQDALTKTIPIWAAVLNRAVQRLRRQQEQQEQQQLGSGSGGGGPPSSSNGSSSSSSGAGRQEGWDEDVHLPPWISHNEKHQILQRLDGWVDQLLQVSWEGEGGGGKEEGEPNKNLS